MLGVSVSVGVWVTVGVLVSVGVAVCVGVLLAVSVGVAVGSGAAQELRRIALMSNAKRILMSAIIFVAMFIAREYGCLAMAFNYLFFA